MKKSRGLGIALSYANTVMNMISGLVLSSFLLLSLGDTEYGLYQTVSSFSSYLVLLEFGTGTVMTRNISVALNRYEGKEQEEIIDRNVSTVWVISLVLSAVMAIGGLIFYLNLGNIYANTMDPSQIAYAKRIMLILFANIIVGYLNQNSNGFLLAHEEYTFANFLSLIRIVIRTLSLIALISLFKYAILIAIVDLTLSVLIFVITFVYSRTRYRVRISLRCFDKQIFIQSIPLCVALLLQTLTNQANNNVDKFVLGIMMNLESVALYSVTQFVFSMFASIGTIPVVMFMPEVSKNMARKLSPMEFNKTLVHPCRLTVLICGSILCGFFAVGKQFISLLYGTDKADAWLYALIILVPMFFNMSNTVIINVLDIANKRLARSLALLGTTIANIILTVWFISLWGIIGAVIATAITMMIGNVIIMNIYYQKKLGIRVFYLFKEAYKGILPFQIIAGVAVFFVARLIPSPMLSLLAGGVLYLVLSLIPIYFLGIKQDEKQKIHSVLKRMKIKK